MLNLYGMLARMASVPTPDWQPFRVNNSTLLEAPRPLQTREGVGDRLRAAAFAEVQAEAAFKWASRHYADASPELKRCWEALAVEERKHRDWLVARMQELEISTDERPVSDMLWHSLIGCESARDFCHYMAGAEERGRRAGVRFHERLSTFDQTTADIFGKIAREELGHIAMAHRFFPS